MNTDTTHDLDLELERLRANRTRYPVIVTRDQAIGLCATIMLAFLTLAAIVAAVVIA